jgi:hypothetical protein
MSIAEERENLVAEDADFLNYCSIAHLLASMITQATAQGF